MREIPEFLYERLEKQYGKELTNKIIDGYKVDRKVTFRVNTLKASVKELECVLDKENIKYSKVEWSDEVFVTENIKEDVIRNLDVYNSGKIYLQSLSSMLPPIILEPKEKESILDMAAAPGGKTTQIAAICNNNVSITACEMNKIRAEKLKYNIEKQGANCVYVMTTDARRLDDFFLFDRILLDAPCSGSGTIELEKLDSENIFTEKLILKSVASQKELLKKALKVLKPGHEIVYSTCSILKEENEEIVKDVLKQFNAEIVPIYKEEFKELPLLPVTLEGTICVCPNGLYEGFFIAKIRKSK